MNLGSVIVRHIKLWLIKGNRQQQSRVKDILSNKDNVMKFPKTRRKSAKFSTTYSTWKKYMHMRSVFATVALHRPTPKCGRHFSSERYTLYIIHYTLLIITYIFRIMHAL